MCKCKLSSIFIQISEEEDPAGHVVGGPTSSTVTDKMSGDVDPQDEAYAHQLESELDAMSDEEEGGGALSGHHQPYRTVSHVKSD